MNTKQLLNEWRSFLSENRIYSMHELVQIIRDTRGEDDVDLFIDFWRNNRFLTKYTQVIKRELETTAETVQEILDACKIHYDKIYQSAGPRDTAAIGSGLVSIDDLRKAIDSKKNFNKNEVRQQCSYVNRRPVVGKYNDFNVFHSGNDWVVIEPKTIQGSIAWAHGKPDGTEETDQSRRVGWCTGVSSGNNMFPNYAGNLHMFYFIKSDYENVKGPDRRLCVSYVNKDGKAMLSDKGSASVDANNRSIKIEHIKNLINENILAKIEEVVAARKETNFTEIYSKMTLSQLLRQVDQMKANNISEKEIKQELSMYCEHAKDPEIVKYCISKDVKEPAARRKDLLKIDPTGELIRQLANDENMDVRATVAARKDLLKIDPTGELITTLAGDKEEYVRGSIASRKDLLKIDPTGELITTLAGDKEVYVRAAVAARKDLLKIDPTGELITTLTNDENFHVRRVIALRKDLLKIDPTGEIITTLANDKKRTIRCDIASRKDLLEIDPRGELIRDLSNDENEYVRSTIAKRKDLLKADPSGVLIRNLVDDEAKLVSSAIKRNPEYMKFLNNLKESLIRDYIKYLIS